MLSKRIFFLMALPMFFLLSIAHGQEDATESEATITVRDSLYREDQLYVGLTFNLFGTTPLNFNQNGFSGGVHFGAIRDMPFNERRNKAIGVGLGLSFNTYNQNLFVGEGENGNSIFRVLDRSETAYDTNRFSTYLVEMPIQYRWRNSTIDSHKFWRIYSGVQLGYVYAYKTTFSQPGNKVVQTDIPEFNRFRAGATFAFGYNTFNFYVYYSLNPFFNQDAQTVSGNDVGLATFKLGLMFYLL